MGLYRCVSITARYDAAHPLAREAWDVWIRTALASLVEEEPFLRVGIADEDSASPCFVHLREVDLGKQVIWHAPPRAADEGAYHAQLSDLLGRGHSSLWPDTENRPPWKVTVVDRSDGASASRSVDVVFSWHHAIGDGLSGKLFHERLLAALREHDVPAGHAPLESPVLRFADAPVLPPPQEEAVKFTVSWWFMLKTLWQEVAPSFLIRKPEAPWAGRQINLNAPFKTNVCLLSLDEKTGGDVLAVCRMHGTTLTGLVHALIVLSLARQLPTEHVFNSQTPISLRPYASAPGFDLSRSMSVLVSVYAHCFPPEQIRSIQYLLSEGKYDAKLDEKVWELAAGVKADLKRRTGELPADDTVGLLRYVGDMRERFKKMDGKSMSTSFEVSNVGVFDGGDPSESLRITSLIFSQSANLVGNAMNVNVAGCRGSGVTITFAWQDSYVDHELVEGVREDVDTWLKNLARSGKLQH